MNNKYKILLIEDEKNIQTFVTAMLAADGYKVISAHNCGNGKMLFSSHNPDLVILDLFKYIGRNESVKIIHEN